MPPTYPTNLSESLSSQINRSIPRIGIKLYDKQRLSATHIGVWSGGARGAAAPPNFGQLRFFGQQEKNWAKPVFKDISMLFYYFEVGVIIQLHSHETVVAYHVMSFWLLGKGIIC